MDVSDKADPNPYTLRPADGSPADALRDVEVELSERWPENKLEPSLDRIEALMDILGQPQRSFPSIHITGTNGKTSTARMIEQLFAVFELRTGRYTSPHVESVTERISLDGAPITPERFVEVYRDIEPYVRMVDEREPVAMSFFEVLTGMAYAAFADAPVDVAVVEVGMGGSWDATNVIDAGVAVITPIGLDHTDKLGRPPARSPSRSQGSSSPTPSRSSPSSSSTPPRPSCGARSRWTPRSPARAWSSASSAANSRSAASW